jgi:hypothetical protein
MILCVIENIDTSKNLISSAAQLAIKLGKTFGIVFKINSKNIESANYKNEISLLLDNLNLKPDIIHIETSNTFDLVDFCESNEISFLFLQLINIKSKTIQNQLNTCRELRIPYLFYKDNFNELRLEKIILPVNFLAEELEKAQFASAFGRYCDSEILILQANDYGSKAETNVMKMIALFEKFSFKFSVEKAQKDSFFVDKEAVQRAEISNAGLIIISASREYGLDDIIFGPKELHLIKKSSIPLLIVNPRADLYTLCD